MLRESEWWGGAGRAEKGGVPVVGARHVEERATCENSCMCLESVCDECVRPGGGSGAVIFI